MQEENKKIPELDISLTIVYKKTMWSADPPMASTTLMAGPLKEEYEHASFPGQ
jgi:hypothetical protein